MSPTAKAANNGHHCPKSGGRWGNCRPWTGCASKPQHCVTHQHVCDLHHEKHLKTELCPTCEKVLDFTGSLPPPAELKPRDYKSTPPKHQKQNYPNQPKGRGAKRGAGRRGNGHGKGNHGKNGKRNT